MTENEQIIALREPAPSCLEIFLLVSLSLWIFFVILARYLVEILASAISPDSAGSELAYLPLVQFLLISFPTFLFYLFSKNPGLRQITRTWLSAMPVILLLLPANLTPPAAMQTQAFWHILGLMLYSLLIYWYWKRSSKKEAPLPFGSAQFPDHWLPLILVFLGLFAIPWLIWGALGSLLDTILQLLTAALFGLSSAIMIEYIYHQHSIHEGRTGIKIFFLDGFVFITVLIIFVSALGFSFSVIQTILGFVLAPAVLLWAFLFQQPISPSGSSISARLREPALLIAGVTALPLIFFDPDELALIISLAPGETLQWLALAAGTSLLIGIFLSVTFILLNPWLKSKARPIWFVSGGIGLLIIFLYFFSGQPGLFGERMLVILNEPANLSDLGDVEDVSERRKQVYFSLAEHTRTTQEPLRSILTRLRIDFTPYYLVNAIEVSQNPLLEIWLEARPDVREVIPSPRLRPLPAVQSPVKGSEELPTSPLWNLTQINAHRVWQELGITGEGIVIGNSDSGFDWQHPELFESYRGNDGNHLYNWLDTWTQAPEPFDINGHGTHTLGTIVGKHIGVAPGATWIGCTNLVRNLGNPALYLGCLQFMLAPYPPGGDPFTQGKPELGAMILNNSWGCPDLEGCNPASLENAVEALRIAGIFVVASAGNEGPACETIRDPLAIYDQVLTVGAVDRLGNLAGFSSRGPVSIDSSQRIKPDLVAPGVDILSSFPGNSFSIQSGTSMAGPHVVGVVALMWSANPALIGDINRTEQILFETSQPYSGEMNACPGAQGRPSTTAGYGRVDAYEAVKYALNERK